jgi:cytochrome c oxidase subunit 2
MRLLEIDNITILPIKININMMGTGGDVIHSYSIGSLGLKKDLIPGICNTGIIRMERESIYAGSCLEGCGSGHYTMTILIRGIRLEKYIDYINIFTL